MNTEKSQALMQAGIEYSRDQYSDSKKRYTVSCYLNFY